MTDIAAKSILSREDLISAGANFCTAFCEKIKPLALNLYPSIITPQSSSVYENQYLVEIGYFAAKIFTSRGIHYFDAEHGHADLRRQLASALRECDPAASEALLVPWPLPSETDWPCAEWASANGLKLDALLYAAAQQRNANAVGLYLNAGADPLCQTYNGDCAARIGIANGMIAQLDRPGWMDGRIQSSGETGLFTLAREGNISDLKHAYSMGADPNVENLNGKTVLHLLDGAFEREIREVIAKAEAVSLQETTKQPSLTAAHVRYRL